MVTRQETEHLTPHEMTQFTQYREAWLSHLPIDSLNLTQESTYQDVVIVVHSTQVTDTPQPKEIGVSPSSHTKGIFPSSKLGQI